MTTRDLMKRLAAEGSRGQQRSIGEVIAGREPAKVRRTWQPVRRNSYNAGERERKLWRPIRPSEIVGILKAAERLDERARKTGERQGPIGEIGLKVLKLLCRLVDYRTGRLEPSYHYLMASLRRSKAAIARALARLRAHGFIDWIRRCEPTGNTGKGPQVRQVSNAYALRVPATASGHAKRAAPPLPDDHAHATEITAAELGAMVDQLPLRERMAFTADNDELAAALTRLGERLGVV